jgi:hypothetical protein
MTESQTKQAGYRRPEVRGFTAQFGKMGHWKKEWKTDHGIEKSEEYSTQWQEVDRDY